MYIYCPLWQPSSQLCSSFSGISALSTDEIKRLLDCLLLELSHLSLPQFHTHYSYSLSPEVSGDKAFPENLLTWKQRDAPGWLQALSYSSVLQLTRHLSKHLHPRTAGGDSDKPNKEGHLQGRIHNFNRYLLNTVKQTGVYFFIRTKH